MKPVAKPAAPALPPAGPKAPIAVPDAESAPDAGSQPRMGPDGGAARAVEGADALNAENSAGLAFLPDPEVGVRIFVAGFIALLFSIGGLVTVAIRRRQW